MRFGTFFVRICCFMTFLKILDVVSILHKHVRSYQFHQIPLLCDHQELACTPKDPPRRVDMKEASLIVFRKNVRKMIELPTKPFQNLLLWNRLKTAYGLLYLHEMNYMNNHWGATWGTLRSGEHAPPL